MSQTPSFIARGIKREGLEQRAAELEKSIQDQLAQLYEIRESLNQTSPIAILPIDILVKVFQSAVFSHPLEKEYFFIATRKLPVQLLILSVCRLWRRVAWSEASLWTSLDVDIQADNAGVQRDLIDEWIMRSGSLPLTVRLRYQSNSSANSEPPTEICQVLHRSCSRWKHLDALGGPFETLKIALEHERCEFPFLSSVFICNDDGLNDTPWFFESAPLLQTLEISNMGADLSKYRVHWHQLNELSLSSDFKSILSLLATSISLRKAKLIAYDSPTSNAPTTKAIHIPHLSNLELDLSSVTRNWFGSMLKNMELPALKILWLEMPMNFSQEAYSGLTSILVKSNCKLTELTLHGIAFREAEFRRILPSLSSLEKLSLITFRGAGFTPLSDGTITFLNPTLASDSACGLPHLVEFCFYGSISFTPTHFISMIKARQDCESESHPNVRPLESVTIMYQNAAWAQEKDPNDVQAFYIQILSLKTIVKIRWHNIQSS